MKKIILVVLCSLGLIGTVAHADDMMNTDMMQMNRMSQDPVCKEAMEHMKADHMKVEEAIKANDAKKVGDLVIACHKYMESFMAKNPQCKMSEKEMMMKKDMMQKEMM